jgi:hypothetical protein
MNIKKTLYIGHVSPTRSMRITVRLADGRLSMIADIGSGRRGGYEGGQCYDAILEYADKGKIEYTPEWDREKLHRLIAVWKRWHLNDMRAGCEHQRLAGGYEVGEPCRTCGYGYGTAWLVEPLPQEIIDYVTGL